MHVGMRASSLAVSVSLILVLVSTGITGGTGGTSIMATKSVVNALFN